MFQKAHLFAWSTQQVDRLGHGSITQHNAAQSRTACDWQYGGTTAHAPERLRMPTAGLSGVEASQDDWLPAEAGLSAVPVLTDAKVLCGPTQLHPPSLLRHATSPVTYPGKRFSHGSLSVSYLRVYASQESGDNCAGWDEGLHSQVTRRERGAFLLRCERYAATDCNTFKAVWASERLTVVQAPVARRNATAAACLLHARPILQVGECAVAHACRLAGAGEEVTVTLTAVSLQGGCCRGSVVGLSTD
jgi:hypothetical protein